MFRQHESIAAPPRLTFTALAINASRKQQLHVAGALHGAFCQQNDAFRHICLISFSSSPSLSRLIALIITLITLVILPDVVRVDFELGRDVPTASWRAGGNVFDELMRARIVQH